MVRLFYKYRGVPRYSSLQGIMSNKLLDIQRDILEMIFNEVLSCREIESFFHIYAVGTRSMIRFVTCSKACYKVVKASKYAAEIYISPLSWSTFEH